MAKKVIIDSELLEANNTELKEYAKNEVDELSEKVINKPDTAEVGQVIAVKAVDENGKPTEFEAVSSTAGGVETDPTVKNKISEHNIPETSHNDIRELIAGLTTRLNTLADSDDTTLDQMSEVVAYIKSNKTLIESVTTNKVNVSDIINNLTTTNTDKPLSANMGVELKKLIDAIVVPTKTSQLTNDSGFLTSHQDISGKADKATTLAGYGITDGATKDELTAFSNDKINYTDVIDNLTSTDTNKPLSANQGKALNNKKANVGAWDLTSKTLEEVYALLCEQPGLFYAGRTKLPASLSPTGTINWFRCVWECQNKDNLASSGLNAIAMLNANIWNGYMTTDSDDNYVLKWYKLTRQEDIVDNLLSTNQYVPLSANQGRILNEKIFDTGYVSSPHTVTLEKAKSMLLTLSDGSTYIIIHLSSGIVITPVVANTASPFQVTSSDNNITVTHTNNENVRLCGIRY